MKTTPENMMNFLTEIDFSEILTNPILDISARVWEEDRYNAFKVCYRSMRIIDDLIDDRKATGKPITKFEKIKYSAIVDSWIKALKKNKPIDDFQDELLKVMSDFKIPPTPWIRLAKAMKYDLYHNGFKSFLTFLRYTEGAAIAPASIFVHLCGINKVNGSYSPPAYDIRMEARELALFSYLVHILRDFQKDQLEGLNYFADDILEKNKIDKVYLKSVAKNSNGELITSNFRNLMSTYYRLANRYREKSRARVTALQPSLAPQYQLSLELIYQLYNQIFERIDCDNSLYTTDELNPTPAEIDEQISKTISAFAPRG